MSFSYEEYAEPICILYTGFATVTPLLQSKNVGYDILDDESLTDVCSLVYINICEKKGSFPSVKRRAEHRVQRNVEEDEIIIDMFQRSPRTSTRRISARFCFPRMRVWRKLHAEGMYPYHIMTPEPLRIGPMCI